MEKKGVKEYEYKEEKNKEEKIEQKRRMEWGEKVMRRKWEGGERQEKAKRERYELKKEDGRGIKGKGEDERGREEP